MDLPLKYAGSRPGFNYRVTFSRPANRQTAAGEMDFNFFVEQTAQAASDHGGTGTSAAGQSFTCAALQYP